MIKLLYGEESYLINANLNKIIKKTEAEFIIFDELDDLSKIIREITTFSIFGDAKNIIVKNHPVIKDVGKAIRFMEQTGDVLGEANIIFILNESRILQTPLIKYIKNNGALQEYKLINNKEIMPKIHELILTQGGNITNSALVKLANKLPNNLWIISNEVKKLLMETNEINDEVVAKSIGHYNIDEYFALTNAIIEGNKRMIVVTYHEKVKNGVQPSFIIDQVAKMLSLAKLVISLRNTGLSNYEIANEIKIHQFRVKKALELVHLNGEQRIDELIIALAELDKNIKIGKLNPKLGLDKYILELIK